MRKLKLESLQVESFVTSIVLRERGTVDAHQSGLTTQTYNVDRCGQTQVFDCTFGCSQFTGCEGLCGNTRYNCPQPSEFGCIQ